VIHEIGDLLRFQLTPLVLACWAACFGLKRAVGMLIVETIGRIRRGRGCWPRQEARCLDLRKVREERRANRQILVRFNMRDPDPARTSRALPLASTGGSPDKGPHRSGH
jgi:hypothetical protein